MPERVLLVEDDTRLAGMVSEYLGGAGFHVSHVGNGAGALERLAREPYDALVLDLTLPDMDGLEVCRRLRARSDTPVLMLTARGEPMDRVVGLELGADDYLPKPFEPRELVARIQAVLRRGRPAENDELLRVGALELNATARSARLDGKELFLTSAEFALLALLVRNRGRVLTRERIMDETKGLDWESYDRSIDVLVSRLRQKLGDDARRPAFIRTIRGTGYSFIGGAE